jgi:hypothetical protein
VIDRRQCVTGLAAAAILPALPAVAQADAPIRFLRSWMAVHDAPDAPAIALVSRWQYEEPGFYRIRHIGSGLAFALSLRAPPLPVAYHACIVLASRWEHPVTEDAPPLPPVDSVLQPAGLFEIAGIMRDRHVVRRAIVGFQHQHEARAFLDDLTERMRNLQLALRP